MNVLSVRCLKRLPWLVAVVVASLAVPNAAEASFNLTPTSGALDATRWEVNDFPPKALNEFSVASKTKSPSKLSLLYKAENEKSVKEEGPFKDDYSTKFEYINYGHKKGNAFHLKWDGPDHIDTSSKTYLVIKTGNKTPNHFVFDITKGSGLSWDGKSTISGYGFWKKSKNAISHVAIFGGKKGSPPIIPEPTSCVLLSLGIACMAGYRGRRRVA